MKVLAVIVSIFLPGIGSLIMGKIVVGVIQFLLWLTGVLLGMTGVGFVVGGLIAFIAWIWGLISVATAQPKTAAPPANV